ncbi:MAG: Holliday junction resolvase RuvX [Alphaproteobacteria bacterium]|nr:Holliday junction resolvase RuvX [Alphaproteobacteria bacterium]
MLCRNPADLAARLARGQRVLGLDVGRKTLGLALSDTTLTVATPLRTLRRSKLARDIAALRAVLAETAAGGLILGLPLNMDGSEGPRCQSVRQFAADLDRALDLPLAFWDERLSTAAVTRFLIEEADASRRRRKALVDKLAAAYILQSALDAIGRER